MHVAVQTNSIPVQKQLVLAGHGWTVLPGLGIAEDVANGTLSAAPLAKPDVAEPSSSNRSVCCGAERAPPSRHLTWYVALDRPRHPQIRPDTARCRGRRPQAGAPDPLGRGQRQMALRPAPGPPERCSPRYVREAKVGDPSDREPVELVQSVGHRHAPCPEVTRRTVAFSHLTALRSTLIFTCPLVR
ncbi:LysR substrate-binding domain-containing protein [Streptomyces sp. NPDC002514]|uniref:LysR substrate-binding domain-containing protein n=1 Tax=Streptomyces sp. NPDC001270 TaxID=3364554 RepID=UPI0036C4DF3A